MPNLRCQGCETVIKVPDAARGKVVACPKCKTKIKVPGGDSGVAAAPRKKKAAGASPDDPLDALANLDLSSFDQKSESLEICPYCAAELDEEDPVCRSCGMNVETGAMDVKEAKRRAIRGPDPARFYSEVWSDSWAFLMEEKKLALRTGLYWTIFATFHATCAYLGLVYCERLPPKTFWIMLTIVGFLGIPGWYLMLAMKVITATITRDPLRSDRIYFDFFQAASAGTRTIFWPLVVMGPFTPAAIIAFFALALSTSSPMVLAGGVLLWVAIPYLLLPVALIHMTARYTYKAWILWELLKVFVKNIGPTLYFHVIVIVALLPVALIALPIFWVTKSLNPFMSENILSVTDKITLWVMGVADLGKDPESFTYTAMKGLFNLGAAFIVLAPLSYAAAFPAIFLMRANGLLGYFNLQTLDMVQRVIPGTPATFWVRYLAHTIDLLFMPLTGFLVTSNAKAFMGFWFVVACSFLIKYFSPALMPVAMIMFPLYTNWMYWVVQESSQLKSTVGKDAFGLLVMTEDGKELSMRQASAKWLLRNLFYFPMSLPFLMAAFHPEKRALHDLATRTKVVWKGDR